MEPRRYNARNAEKTCVLHAKLSGTTIKHVIKLKRNNIKTGHTILELINALSAIFLSRKIKDAAICHVRVVDIAGAGCVDYP